MTATTLPPPRTTGSSQFRADVRAAWMVCRRELIRFSRTRARIISSLIQPLLFLFVLGGGLTPLIGEAGGLDFTGFVFPGVIAFSVLTTAIFGAVSIVWDREFGFAREMLVAPVSRGALIAGKAIGGALVATAQGSIMLVLSPLVGIELTVLVVLQALGAAAIMAFSLTSFGLFIASHVTRMEAFQTIMQLVLLPMLFLSGALFPINDLPGWLGVLTRLNPVTYAIDPLRRIILGAQDLGTAATEQFGAGIELFGHVLSVPVELLIVTVFGVVLLAGAMRAFGRPD